MNQLPNINYHMESMSQYLHIYWSNTTAVMEKTNIASNFIRIRKSPHLLFYDFSMNYYAFPKFLQNRFYIGNPELFTN